MSKDSITVRLNGKIIKEGKGYTYNKKTNVITYKYAPSDTHVYIVSYPLEAPNNKMTKKDKVQVKKELAKIDPKVMEDIEECSLPAIALQKQKTDLIPHTTIVEKFKLKIKWRKEHPKLAKLQDIWWWIRYGIKNKIVDFPSEVKYFIQRGKNGISQRDIWGLDYYLATTISKGIDKLIQDVHGHPTNLKNLREWKAILKKISKTFKMEEKIIDSELIYLPIKKFNDKKRKDIIKWTKESNKDFDLNYKVMTKKENIAYQKGWELFVFYFRNLWD